MTKIAGSGSISQKHESADLDSDPNSHQNVMDTEHWKEGTVQRVQDRGYMTGHLCTSYRKEWLVHVDSLYCSVHAHHVDSYNLTP
jgi:hypothetical protein